MSSKANKVRNTILAITPLVILSGILLYFTFDSYSPHPGEPLYQTHCANCHGPEGEGLRDLYPPLAQSDYLAANEDILPCIIKAGMSGPIQVNGKEYNMLMPGVPFLSDGEVTNLMNYIYGRWENDGRHVTLTEVREDLANCNPIRGSDQ